MSDQHDLVNLRQARKIHPMHHATLRRLIDAAGVELFADPTDRRVLLVRRDDLARIAAPRSLRSTEGERPLQTA